MMLGDIFAPHSFTAKSHWLPRVHPMASSECCSREACQWHAAIEHLREEIQTMRAEQQDVNEQLLSGLQILLDRDPHGGFSHLERSASIKSLKRVRPPKMPRAECPSETQKSSTFIPEVADLERTLMMSDSAPRRPLEAKRSAVHPVSPDPPEDPRYEEPISGRRGSTLGILNRTFHSRILSMDGSGSEIVWKIFEESIGVSMWLNWSNCMICFILVMDLAYIAAITTLQVQGLQEASEAFALLVYSIVAILFLKLVKRSLRSGELNVAMQRLDEFVRDCGRGLDWASMAKKSWRRFLALWLLVVLAFVVQQTLEIWMAEEFRFQWKANLRIVKGATGTLLFAVASAVVMNGAYCQVTLVQGLQKTVDCWCGDLMADRDFVAGISSWRTLQALLKCVGREMTSCFLALSLFGHAGFFAFVAGSFSLLLGDDLEGHRVALYEFAMLPLIYLFFLSARLFAVGAGLSEKCRHVPAFVNQLIGQTEPDAERQYLVRYISHSEAGFIVYGIALSQNALLKQVHLLTAVCSGFGGILMRRFL